MTALGSIAVIDLAKTRLDDRPTMPTETFRTLEQALLLTAARALGRTDPAGLRTSDAQSAAAGDVAIGCHSLAKELKSDPQSLATTIATALAGDARFVAAKAENGYCNVRFARPLLFRVVAGEVAEEIGRASCRERV